MINERVVVEMSELKLEVLEIDAEITIFINVIKNNAMIGWAFYVEDPKLTKWKQRKGIIKSDQNL